MLTSTKPLLEADSTTVRDARVLPPQDEHVLYGLCERAVSFLRGRPYHIDREIPVSAFCESVATKACYLARGLIKSTLFQFRPTVLFVGPRVQLRNAALCRFGKQVTLETGVRIDGLSRSGVCLGDNVVLGAYSVVRSSSMQGLGWGLTLGNNCSCDAWCFFGAGGQITIGDNVIMGQHTSFHAETHQHQSLEMPIRTQGIVYVPIVVEDDCWIGANVTVLGGAHIGRGCIVGAGSVVRGSFPAYSVIAGVPAKVIRSRLPSSEEELLDVD